MEIIDELEPTRRGVYCGSLFALGFDGSLSSSVAIRTLQIADRVAQLHVGAGIVADSESDLEYDETRHKAAGILAALGLEE
jgi:para-aminobenzoate synthetase component 1